jgi:hypothetical protein
MNFTHNSTGAPLINGAATLRPAVGRALALALVESRRLYPSLAADAWRD